MYCGKCGAKNSDDTRFCAQCGAPIQTTSTPKDPPKAPQARPRTLSKAAPQVNIRMIAVALAAVVVLISVFGIFTGRSANKTANQMLHALEDFDLVKVYALYPKPIQKWLRESEDMSKKEYKQMLKEENEEFQEELSLFGSEIQWSKSGVKNAKDQLKDTKALYKEQGMRISGVKTATIEMSVNFLGYDSTQELDIKLIKYKGSWYLDYFSMGGIF